MEESKKDESAKRNTEIFRKYFKYRIYKFAFPFSFAFYGLLGLVLTIFFPNVLGSNNSKSFQYLFISMGTIGLFWMMSNYLDTSKADSNNFDGRADSRDILERLRELSYQHEDRVKEIFLSFSKRIEENINRRESELLTSEQKLAIYEKLHHSLSENLNTNFYAQIETAIKNSILEQKREETYNATKSYDDAIKRLKAEIIILTKRANLNLIIGTMISISALFLLGYFVLRENFNSSNLFNVLLHFIPRLSLVVFIELFAFFFLKLYRTSLSEIKYYQNELTNIELRQISLLAALNRGSQEGLSIVIKELIMTERNFKLSKGESTVELEKTKLENKGLKEMLSIVSASSKGKKD
ncbi:hypothetical protein FC093_00160 [Ilyomonas limi]|uniref:Uncharacterized protein n=1 Tax=Ilyomonas limi TaxID=2575867 RepID=A0A4U3L888_9BACT|nr:hypothetical protein [Ilyomonas limi]TKK71478.1 hypothetical protein FC093_00160 [Ilyomonas limi]